jgi:hypothetical protein
VRFSKSFEFRCDYWYCNHPECPAGLTGHHDQSQAEAEAHVRESGHEARVVKTRELILRPAELAEVSHA